MTSWSSLPLAFAVLRRNDGTPHVWALHAMTPFGVGRTVEEVAADLERAIQTRWVDQRVGLVGLLGFGVPEATVAELAVELPRGSLAGAAHPLRLTLHAFWSPVRRGVVVEVPALGVRTWGRDEAEALDRARGLSQAALVELARPPLPPSASGRSEVARAGELQALVDRLWFTSAEVVVHPLRLQPAGAARREEVADASARALVERVAHPLSPRRAHHLDGPRQELRAAARSTVRAGVLVVGPSGCGKTCLIADEAHRPDSVFGAGVVSTSASHLIRGLSVFWQETLPVLCAALERLDLWLHVADFADLFEVGRSVGNPLSVGEVLRGPLAEGRLRLIGECSAERFAALTLRYPGLVELLTRVDLPAPDEDAEAKVMVAWCKEHPTVELDAALEVARWYRRFLPHFGAPGAALRFLDGFEEAGQLAEVDTVRERFCRESGLSRALLDPSVPLTSQELVRRFEGALFGQPEAVDALVDATTAIRADVARRGRPIATLLFTGPTGVGKTEAARVLATVLFGGPERMVRLDMSEFSTAHAAQGLAASPLLEGRGRLTAPVEIQPFCLLLLDEVEKADPHAFDLLLQVLDEGRLTDGRGRTVSFCGCVVVMTSNVGARAATQPRIGLGRGAPDNARELKDAVLQSFRPEFVNRLDRIVPFRPLAPESVRRVLDRELQALAGSPILTRSRVSLSVTEAGRARLVAGGWDPTRGARPLQRLLRDEVVAPLSVILNRSPDLVGQEVQIDAQGSRLVVRELSPGTLAPASVPDHPRLQQVREAIRRLRRSSAWGELVERILDQGPLLAAQAAAGEAPEGAEQWLALRDLRQKGERLGRQLADLVGRLVVQGLEGAALDRELEGLAEAADDLALRLFDHQHPSLRETCVGFYPTGNVSRRGLESWVDSYLLDLDALGIHLVGRRWVWVSDGGGQVVDLPPGAPAPSPAHHWVGTEVWLAGPAAGWRAPPGHPRYALVDPNLEVGLVDVRCSSPPGPEELLAPWVAVEGPESGRPKEPWRCWVPRRPQPILRPMLEELAGPPADWPPPARSRAAGMSSIFHYLTDADPLRGTLAFPDAYL